MIRIFSFALLFLTVTHTPAQVKSEVFEFEFEGVMLNGILDFPVNKTPKGIVLIVHGSGRTNAVVQNLHQDVRKTIVQSGYAVYMWDKMGCGKSEGTFNYNQSVHNSALEVIAAITALRDKKIPGSKEVGLWGISRAGWTIPLVINQYESIKFWISVSGVDDKENFKYLLEQNLRINGLPKDSINLIADEWLEGVKITHSGGSYETYLEATSNLWQNEFLLRFSGGGITKEGYYNFQRTFVKEELDEATGLQFYIRDFERILSSVHCPVLALFGEKDMNVDWTKTKELYERTLAPNIDLTIQSFPDCNHNLFQCKTGGFYEIQDNNLPWKRCEGFLEAMKNWLNNI